MGLIRRVKSLFSTPVKADQADSEAISHEAVKPNAGADAAEQCRREGNAALQQGSVDTALACYQRFAAFQPDNSSAHLNVGYALFALRRFSQATVALQRSLDLDPNSHETLFFLGCAKAELGDLQGATVTLSRAVTLAPGFDAGWVQLGLIQESQNAHGQAIQCYRRAISIQPNIIEGWQGLARSALAQRQYTQALEATDSWLVLDAGSSTAHGMRADALRQLGRKTEALAEAEKAVALLGDDPMLWEVNGWALIDTGHHEQAVKTFRKALALAPQARGTLAGLGVAYYHLNRPEEALEAFEDLATIDCNYENLAHNLALSQMQMLRMDEAIKILHEAIGRSPQDAHLHFDLAKAELTLGHYEAGWREYEWRLALSAPTASRASSKATIPPWQPGAAVAGKHILVTSEQGLGDSIQFARYIPALIAQGARVTLQVSPRFRSLVEGNWDNCTVLTQTPGEPLFFELRCTLMSLPYLMGIAEPLGADFPYVRADITRRDYWRGRTGKRKELTVGLVWAGNQNFRDDAGRSIPLDMFRVAAPENIKFISLQFDIRNSDMAAKDAWPDLLHFGAEQRDLADTAALIELLDAVVCVDTSIAHLSGALGIPVFILLQYCPDWRWQLDREDTPWYPSARLIRQDASRQWQPVIQRAMALLGNLEKFNAHDNDSAGTSRATPSAEVMPPVP